LQSIEMVQPERLNWLGSRNSQNSGTGCTMIEQTIRHQDNVDGKQFA
jgi:hypothetical protein